MEPVHCVILFADIRNSTEFAYTQGVERYNEMLRDFHRTMHRAVREFRKRHQLSADRLKASARGDECCVFLCGGKDDEDAVLAIDLAVYLKESWKASKFCVLNWRAAETGLIPQVDLRIGIGCGEVALDYDVWTKTQTLEGIVISEAKRIEAMAGEAAEEHAKKTLILVKWDVKEACGRLRPEISFGSSMPLKGKGVPTFHDIPLYPVLSYPAWEKIQRQVVPTPQTPWEVFNQALALHLSGDFDAAIAEDQRALKIDPAFQEAWVDLGRLWLHKGEFDEAIRCFNKAIEIKADLHEDWNNMGNAYVYKPQPNYDEAIRCYRKAIELDPDHRMAWYNMGIAYRYKQDYDEAIRCYLRAIEIKPDDHEAWYNMGCAYALKGDVNRAVEHLAQAISLRPDYKEKAKADTDFDGIREEPAFQALLAG